MEKYKIEKFKTPIKKNYKLIKKYDVIKTEYGDFDNVIEAMVLGLKVIKNSTILELTLVGCDGIPFTTHYFMLNNDATFNVIGKAKIIEPDLQK